MGNDVVRHLGLLKSVNPHDFTVGAVAVVTAKNLTVKANPPAHTMNCHRSTLGGVIVEGIWSDGTKKYWHVVTTGDFIQMSSLDAEKYMEKEVEGEVMEVAPDFQYKPWSEVQKIQDFVISSDKLRVMQSRLRRGHNILVKGEPGTGKTVLAEMFAAAIGYPFFRLDVGGIQRSIDWYGEKDYTPDRGTFFRMSKFLQMIQEPCVLQLNEINRTSPETPNAIYSLLDDIRRVYVDQLGMTIFRHPNCYIFGTLNEGPHFTGTYPLDPAFTDRFTIMELELPSETELAILLTTQITPNRRGEKLAEADSVTLARVVRKLAEMYSSGKISKYVGFRAAKNAGELRVDGEALDFAVRESIINVFSREGGTSSERTKVLMELQGYFPSFAADPAVMAAKKKP